jgi:rod shape-determining protein MreC
MQRLLSIILLFKEYFVVALLIVTSLILLSFNDNVQIRAIRSYTIGFIGIIQDAVSIVPNILELKRENEILRQLNVNLSDEVNRLREARLENMRLRAMLGMKEKSEFKLVPGDIVGKSLQLLRNTVTLNIGEQDGVKPDMPVISETGLVGKIITTSTHYSVGQLMLNKDFRASAKIQRSRIDGIVAWDGGDAIQLMNVAKTADVKIGDVVTTSEYSSVFPPEIKIGVVSRLAEQPGSLFKEIDVTPVVDFPSIEQVFVVTALADTERVNLDRKTSRPKK